MHSLRLALNFTNIIVKIVSRYNVNKVSGYFMPRMKFFSNKYSNTFA